MQVVFKCPVRKTVRTVQVTDQGKVKRVRGVAWGARVSPALANRLVEAAKGRLLQFLPDVYITTDHSTGGRSGSRCEQSLQCVKLIMMSKSYPCLTKLWGKTTW